MNVIEYDDRYELQLALPGYVREDVQITVEEGLLKLNGQKEISEGKLNYRLREFNYSEFEKNFKLPESIDISNIEAAFELGILTITLRLKEEAIPQPPRKIIIK